MPKLTINTFRTTRNDSFYRYVVDGLFSGRSVSHVSLGFTFDPNILKPENFLGPGEWQAIQSMQNRGLIQSNEAYFSFWPEKNGDPVSTGSRLIPYYQDTETAALGSPMPMQPKYSHFLQQDHATVSSFLPLFGDLAKTTMPLGPSITFHMTSFESRYGKKALDSAVIFTKKYEEWCDAKLALNNAKKGYFSFLQPIKDLQAKVDAAADAQSAALKSLVTDINKSDAPPECKISSDNTDRQMEILEKYFTFGTREADTASIQISDEQAIKMLKEMANISANPEKYPYNLAYKNCANMALEILKTSAGDNKELLSAIQMPWYTRYLPFPVVPGMILSAVIRGNEVLEKQKKEAELFAVHKSQSDDPQAINKHHYGFRAVNDYLHEHHILPIRLLHIGQGVRSLLHHTKSSAQVAPAPTSNGIPKAPPPNHAPGGNSSGPGGP